MVQNKGMKGAYLKCLRRKLDWENGKWDLREPKSKVSQQEEMEEVNRTPKSDSTHYDTVRWGRRGWTFSMQELSNKLIGESAHN